MHNILNFLDDENVYPIDLYIVDRH